MCQAEEKTRVGGLVAFPIQRHPPIPPRASQPRVDKCILSLLPRCKGWGRAAAECPRTKAPPGACAEVTCRLQGRLRRTAEGIWRKWCCSLGNQFVPPLIGHFALPLWDFQANVLPGLSKSVINRSVLEETTPFHVCAPSIARAP